MLPRLPAPPVCPGVVSSAAVESTALSAVEHVRILVVEDHRIVREGLCLYLAREPRFEVVAAVGTGEDAVKERSEEHTSELQSH